MRKQEEGRRDTGCQVARGSWKCIRVDQKVGWKNVKGKQSNSIPVSESLIVHVLYEKPNI